MDDTEEPRALDRSSIQSSDNIEQSALQKATASRILQSGDETMNLLSHAKNKLTPTLEDDPNASFLAAAADQHKFTKRAFVNTTLCDLCRKCIGDIITGDCFPKSASERSSRWTHERTPMHRLDKELSFRYYEDIKSVEISALRGCKLCLMISRGCWQSGSRQMYISVTCLRNRTPFNNITIQDTTKELWMIFSWMRGSTYFQAFYPFVKKIDPQETDLNQQEWYFRYTGSQKVMATIRTWMSECLETHSLCAPQTPSSLPSRVIDVGQAGSLDEPYLLESGDRAAPYLALSYCWGSGKRLITTRDSITRRRAGFMLAELPETLRDAILVTRRLGVRYLWVDALCIMQDDGNDWLSESSNMRAIYRNAVFVISALDASHSDSGIFYDRIALLSSSDAVNATSAGLYIREDPGPHSYLSPHGQSSLGERAWALQEHFMATALLHFSRQRLCWECRTCSLYEGGLRRDNHPVRKGLRRGHDVDRGKKDWGFDYPMTWGLGQDYDMSRPVDEWDWYHLVNLFSQRRLTYISDKLAAVAGLATEFDEQGWCQGYLVGLWNSDLLRGLLWQTDTTALTAEEFEKHDINLRLPSWSWASSVRYISWSDILYDHERIRTHYDSAVEGFRVELSDESKAAILVEGSITFKAFMILLSHDELVLPYFSQWPEDQIFKREAKSINGEGHLDVPTKRPCWLTRMATWEKQYDTEHSEFHTFFLLLEEVSDGHVFRRVGNFSKIHFVPKDQLTIDEMVYREITII